jgi:hypothetical protein
MPMFDEVESAVAAVADDLAQGFGGIFEGRSDLVPVGRFAEEVVGTISETVSVVAWEWPVTHVGPIQGTPATGRELVMRGVTVIEREETVVGRREDVVDGGAGDLVFSRYIDWLALYAELGAVTISRPQVDDRSGLPENQPHPVPDG